MKFNKVILREELNHHPYPVGKEIHSSYNVARKMADVIEELFPDMNIRLICQGSSGAILSALIYSFLRNRVIEIIHIKKPNEECHLDGHCVTGMFSDNVKNIIVDDII